MEILKPYAASCLLPNAEGYKPTDSVIRYRRKGMTSENWSDLDEGTLQQYLPGVNFPADREEIASTAERNGAPQELVETIRNNAPTSFNTLAELSEWLEVERGKRPG
jgi:Protein of unknown function (DUF2795)